jgi:ferritin-like metal-binding protein YciE
MPGDATRGDMTLHDLLLSELQTLLDAEQQLATSQPLMAASATGDALRAALASHLEETRAHVERLEEVLRQLEGPVEPRPCAAMAGIIAEAARMSSRTDVDSAVRDAALIAGAQKIERYEICSYATCAAWARSLGRDAAARRLEETLDEERAADQALNDLAAQEVTISATNEASS